MNTGSRAQPYDAQNSRSWQPRLGPYQDDEWYNLTLAQKNRVWDLRNAAETHDNQRSVNQVSFIDDLTESSQAPNNSPQLPPPPPSIQVPPPANNTNGSNASRGSAGSAFGRNNQTNNGRRYN